MIVDVTVPSSGGRGRRPGIRIHRARDLDGQTTTHDWIPVTTAARTILDLAATLQRRPLERVLDQAENARLADVASLEAPGPSPRGPSRNEQVARSADPPHPGTTLTKSELEELFLKLCDEIGRPRVNERVTGPEVDFVFAEQRLLVETDSWCHHLTREAFERDRERDAIHTVAGYRTLRFTHRQLTQDPRTVAATLEAALNPANAGTPIP